MKFIRLEPVEHNIKFIGFKVPAYVEDFGVDDELYTKTDIINRFTQYNDNENRFECLIDIDNGVIVGYTANIEINIFDKCVDEGTYVLYDENMNVVCEYEGYVPNILEVNENGYGDYLNFTINPDGTIINWENHINALKPTIFDEWDKYMDD
jgi:hypothetical protein